MTIGVKTLATPQGAWGLKYIYSDGWPHKKGEDGRKTQPSQPEDDRNIYEISFKINNREVSVFVWRSIMKCVFHTKKEKLFAWINIIHPEANGKEIPTHTPNQETCPLKKRTFLFFPWPNVLMSRRPRGYLVFFYNSKFRCVCSRSCSTLKIGGIQTDIKSCILLGQKNNHHSQGLS